MVVDIVLIANGIVNDLTQRRGSISVRFSKKMTRSALLIH